MKKHQEKFNYAKLYDPITIQDGYSEDKNSLVRITLSAHSYRDHENIKMKLKKSTTFGKMKSDVARLIKKKALAKVKEIIPSEQNPNVNIVPQDSYERARLNINLRLTFANPNEYKILKQSKDKISKEMAHSITVLAHAHRKSTKEVLTDLVKKLKGVNLPAHHLEQKDQSKP
jgi:hypothetical protein